MRRLRRLPGLMGLCLAGAAAAQTAGPLAADQQGLNAFPKDPSREIVVRACSPCHSPGLVVAKRRSAEEWESLIAAMVDRGAVATDDEQLAIQRYFVRFFGQEISSRPND
jgi:competence protein ComEA